MSGGHDEKQPDGDGNSRPGAAGDDLDPSTAAPGAPRRLYRCRQCAMIYWGHELLPEARSFPALLSVPCPTPGCGARALFGQGTPGEVGCIHGFVFALVVFGLSLWVVKWGFWYSLLAAAGGAAIAAWISRALHRPAKSAQDQHFAAHQVAGAAEALHRSGRLEMARYAFERAEKLLGRGVDAKLEAAIVGRLANVERELGDFAAARPHYERALEIAEQIGDVSGRINRHNNIAVLLGDDLRDPVGAIEHVDAALALAQSMNDPERICRMRIHLAKRQREARRLEQAETEADRALRVARSIHRDDLVADALHERACLRMTQARNELAQADLEEALRRLGPAAGDRLGRHIQTALRTVRAAIRDGATVTIGPPGQQWPDEARLPFELSPEASEALSEGMEHMTAGRLVLAAAALRRALRTPAVDNDPKARALARSNMGDMLREMGKGAEAEEALRRAVADAREAGVPFLECQARLNLGLVLHVKGAWAESRECLECALDLAGEHGDARAAGRLHLALGNLSRDSADYALAEEHYQKAGQLARQQEDRQLEGSVNQSLGNMYFKQRLWDRARPYFEQAKGLAERTRDARLQGIALHMLGNVYRRLGRLTEALEMLRSSVSTAHACPTEVGMAGRLNDLGVVEQELGRLPEALEHYQRSAGIYRRGGLSSPDIAGCFENLGVLLARSGQVDAGRDHILAASAMDNEMISQAFAIASEDARLEFLRQAERRLDDLVSLVARGGPCEGEPSTVLACADVVLRRKGASLEALAVQREMTASGRYPKLAGALKELSQVRMELAQLTLAGKAVRAGEYTPHAGALVERKRHLEQQVAREVPEVALDERLRRAERRAVALALPEASVLVEFLRFTFFAYPPPQEQAMWSADRYAAFVLPAGRPDDIQMIDLGDAEPIDRMIAAFRDVIMGQARPERRDLGAPAPGRTTEQLCEEGARLRAALFDPLTPALAGVERLLLAPDHNLTQLPFEVLPAGDDRYLIDRFQISYLSAGRDALRLGAPPPARAAQPLVVADPDFDLCSPDEAPRQPAARGQLSRHLDRNLRFGRLPGTRVEGEQVAGMLRVEPWTGAEALEGRLKRARAPHILHLATHGHFLRDQSWGAGGRPRGLSADGPAEGLESPLLRSWLALAGANAFLGNRRTPPHAEDGLLTAEDVSGMDFTDTDLVVLSACETGLGRASTGEGVFGLRRAFVIAGAKTLVMSLWKVPDRQTQELMREFYARLLRGQARAEALRDAQIAVRSLYADPIYWGGFICQGDPGILPSRDRQQDDGGG